MAQNDTKYMESAIALSEELNFTRAAQKLRISQPAITRNIAELEAVLGFPLFIRNRKTVTMTDAGRAYVEQARLALLYGERALYAARSVTQHADAVLHVGRSPYVDPFLVSTLQSIRLSQFPRLRLDLSSQYSYDLVHEILIGALDLAIVNEPPASALLAAVKVADSPFYIAMSKRDRLARQPAVTLDALGGRDWVLFERRLHPPVYDSIVQLAESKKVLHGTIHHITAPEEAYPFIADGSCVAFLVKAGALIMARDGLTVRPLDEPDLSLKTYLASRVENDSKLVSQLMRAFVRSLANQNQDRRKPRSLPLAV